jgi:hypothetical protein
MAYQNSNRTHLNSNSQAAAKKVENTAKKAIFTTGLFAPNREGVKSIGSVQIKEDIVLPAGSYINLYEADKKDDKSPAFRMSVTEGKLASAK